MSRKYGRRMKIWQVASNTEIDALQIILPNLLRIGIINPYLSAVYGRSDRPDDRGIPTSRGDFFTKCIPIRKGIRKS